ncbi:GNAT family N-acetyltransferase [Halobacterium litoreum]|uniref:GNAT family N-acetyltransferase n=1 Tax=Halobacterium litoreum TaxID=2039234 RepID=A0ABD5NFP3_9EURY|nr:GNAT family protein [Halobacterium litoreum]UHH13416.1 GNAT family N-acetyltransferase [Halobacterium litoreum]
MPGPVFAEGESVTLRTIEEEDLEFLQRGRNHPEIRRPLTDVDPQNGEQIREYFENGVSGDGDGFGFLICAPEESDDADGEDDDSEADPVPVGAVHIPWVRTKHGSGMLMYWVLPEYQGNGYVTEATELILDFAFEERRLAKVYAVVLESNVGSQRVLERLGFEREGVHRRESFVAGERVDNYRYGVLADEWLDQSET